MRLIALQHVKEGDIIGKDIIDEWGNVLLRKDTPFKQIFCARLIERQISSLYIEDELSKGIEPVAILDSQIRTRLTNDIRDQFDKLQRNLVIDGEALHHITRQLIEVLDSQDMILELDDLKASDDYTYEHCLAVAILAHVICTRLQMNEDEKEKIVMGALIHDIGKVSIPKHILNKPGRLTDEEYVIIKEHAGMGYKMVKDNESLSPVTKLAVLCHHEREDGSGYPLGKGEDLHIGTKIVAACDLYHALVSDRCYRRGLPLEEVMSILDQEPINEDIRYMLERSVCYYPVGCLVELSNGKLGIVEKNFSADIRRPKIRLIERIEGQHVSTRTIDLQVEPSICIVGRYNEPI